ncbi:larval cuticle protein A2B-like [Cloeon dipterum]|uniref:larval cuticle protein A2B-like n=1 Tax=Cloeon dipterum TaxID=197152 RepID=UPI0032206B34
MALRLVAFLALVAASRAGVPFGYAAAPAPVAVAPALAPVDAVPQYSFGYSVSDALTGDNKLQHETRHGDIVQGAYSLVEPDGTVRTVNYIADPINGFNAHVSRQPAVVKAAVPAVPAAPVLPAPLVRAPLAAPAPVFAGPAVAPAVAPAPFAPYAAYPGYGAPVARFIG